MVPEKTASTCPLCSSTATTPFLRGTRDLHYGIAGAWDYNRCGACGVVYLEPAPNAEFLADSYDDSYYSYQDFKLPSRWRLLARRVTGFDPGRTGDPKFRTAGRILDIGCGSGSFLHRMKLEGWETWGVELSRKAADLGNSLHGLNIQAGTVHQAKLPAAAFDYIRLNHSFEHLLDPRATLDRIRSLLAPEGLLFIGVPNVDSVPAAVFGRHWWNLGPPVHPFGYSARTLTPLLREHGFEVVSSRTNSNFAGVLGSFQMRWNEQRGVYSDTGVLFTNPLAKLLTHWVAKVIDMFEAGDCLELVARSATTSCRCG